MSVYAFLRYLKADLLQCFLFFFNKSRVMVNTCSLSLIHHIVLQAQKRIKHIYGEGFICYYYFNNCSIIDLEMD